MNCYTCLGGSVVGRSGGEQDYDVVDRRPVARRRRQQVLASAHEPLVRFGLAARITERGEVCLEGVRCRVVVKLDFLSDLCRLSESTDSRHAAVDAVQFVDDVRHERLHPVEIVGGGCRRRLLKTVRLVQHENYIDRTISSSCNNTPTRRERSMTF